MKSMEEEEEEEKISKEHSNEIAHMHYLRMFRKIWWNDLIYISYRK